MNRQVGPAWWPIHTRCPQAMEGLLPMRRALRDAIPSMFHRRLVLLAVCACAVIVLLVLSAARLTVGPAHANASREAASKLRIVEIVPTVRGRILDRRGRVLAHDEAGWDIAVNYSLIDGSWAHRQALAAARASNPNRPWASIPAAERERLLATHQLDFDRQVDELWTMLGDLGGLGPQQIEHRRTDIASRVQDLKAFLMTRWREELSDELGSDVPLSAVDRPIAEERQPHAVLYDVSDFVRQEVQRFIADAATDRPEAMGMRAWREVVVHRPTQRRYPLETMTLLVDRSTLPPTIADQVEQEITVEGVAMHLLGQTRKIKAEDLTRLNRPFSRINADGQVVYDLGGYSARWPDDNVGSGALEQAMEQQLRGSRGRYLRHLDNGHREVHAEPRAGHDIQTTLDIQLQARIQAIMSPEFGLMVTNTWHGSKASEAGDLGKPLAGAAVVMDVETGEVLAAVSMPAMPLRLLRDDPDQIFRNPEYLPWVNRVTMTSYQPGSTLKPFVLLAAASAGVHDVQTPIRCEGIFDRDHPTRHRCWIFRQYMSQHGPVSAARSLEVSCNIYYYTLGKRLGIPALNQWYGRFGLGAPTGCGVEESPGDLPDPATTYRDESINMGIGQGPVGWTPLQAAAAYAMLGRDGDYIAPTFIIDEHRTSQRRQEKLKLNAAALREAMEGLHGSVYGSEGTGRHLPLEGRPLIFNAKGVTVFGKSGTAQTGRFRWIDHNLDGQRDPGEVIPDPETHAWFVALVQPDAARRPTHAIIVITEYAGSGAKVSGPIVNQIIHALQTEGYLPS